MTVSLGHLNANDDGLQGPPAYGAANHRSAEMPEENNVTGGPPSYAEAMAGREQEAGRSGEHNVGNEPNVNDGGEQPVREVVSGDAQH